MSTRETFNIHRALVVRYMDNTLYVTIPSVSGPLVEIGIPYYSSSSPTPGSYVWIASTYSFDKFFVVSDGAVGTTESGDFVLKTGDTMTGELILPNDPTSPLSAATKQYVDAGVGGNFVLKTGDTMTGELTLSGDPTSNLSAAPKQYVDTQDGLRVLKTGDTMTGALTISGANLSVTSPGVITGDGSGLTTLNATNLSSGTVPSARISGSYTGITGTGALNAGSITSGFGNINIGTSTFTGNGSGLSSLAAANLTGTVASARISGSYTGITGTGALNAGSITSGFGAINNGTSGATMAGTVTIGGTGQYLRFRDTVDNSHYAEFRTANLTANRIFTWPNAAGTVIGTGNLTSITAVGAITAGSRGNGNLAGVRQASSGASGRVGITATVSQAAILSTITAARSGFALCWYAFDFAAATAGGATAVGKLQVSVNGGAFADVSAAGQCLYNSATSMGRTVTSNVGVQTLAAGSTYRFRTVDFLFGSGGSYNRGATHTRMQVLYFETG